jgi:hypothetical protein
MPTKTDSYRAQLRSLRGWESFLLAESNLPGPRANLELAQAAADEGSLDQFRAWLRSPHEYLTLCGAIGLGRLVADGELALLAELRAAANDPRWRVREGVAMGLQRFGTHNWAGLLETLRDWSNGSLLERRAVVAAVCEPPLLRSEPAAEAALELLDSITTSLRQEEKRSDESFRVLRQALAYGWSVAVAAAPGAGKPLLEKWLASEDKDIAWLARENLKKDRLKRMDATWVGQWSGR